ncbi:hypothetical protein V8G54_024303, partial [Vigna mungo]
IADPKPQIHNFRNPNPNVAKEELQFVFQSTEKKAKATRAQTRSPFTAKTLESDILASRNIMLEPLETRLSFPARKPQIEPKKGKGERKEPITIYPENTKTLLGHALSMLSSSPPFVPARNTEALFSLQDEPE